MAGDASTNRRVGNKGDVMKYVTINGHCDDCERYQDDTSYCEKCVIHHKGLVWRRSLVQDIAELECCLESGGLLNRDAKNKEEPAVPIVPKNSNELETNCNEDALCCKTHQFCYLPVDVARDYPPKRVNDHFPNRGRGRRV
jgi:hypothetical protein